MEPTSTTIVSTDLFGYVLLLVGAVGIAIDVILVYGTGVAFLPGWLSAPLARVDESMRQTLFFALVAVDAAIALVGLATLTYPPVTDAMERFLAR